ncbi:1-aminocyclopropane-1-carboxylate deaminase/D-cysteine desulfhydrase [Spirosoma aerolatum]|uniref:1-aminocyclopropane-1-carboxylate deaminase/D-cysteine desulfhydrase n=1 Tax=Spirosoma aerolatum TaxID=1211326 RepID=UPI0009AEA055|nr:pyridoxal-phosphate dependent enzyme [Spirosoma aerolatum]
MHSLLQSLDNPFPESINIRLLLKRDDLLHPHISGNKWRKLKYNLLAARQQGFDTLLTFGGAYSNHLYATAAAGQAFGFRTIGVVRGDELAQAPRNKTLQACEDYGMTLHFVSRADYRKKQEEAFWADLIAQFGSCYILPEGGTNELAIQGTAEIIPELIAQLGAIPDYVCCPVGTGGTVAGLALSAPERMQVIGFVVLKADSGFAFQIIRVAESKPTNLTLLPDYHFGGYARTTPQLIEFIRAFERKTGLLLDQVYTGKMLFGIYDLARRGYFSEGATVVAIHTGGLQGRSDELTMLIP